MAIELTGVFVKHERRIRLVFSNALASGAFGTPGPSFYVITNQDGHGPSPGVASALLVSGAGTNVELALDTDIVTGALYRIVAVGVPAVDASTSTSASDETFRFGVAASKKSVEPKVLDADLLLYSRDLVFTGSDYMETVEGDLSQVGGLANAQGAFRRRMLGSPLAWAPNYSPKARQYVDGTLPAVGGLRGQLQQQALQDDRVRSAGVQLVINDATPDQSYFEVRPVFIGGQAPEPVSVSVPVT